MSNQVQTTNQQGAVAKTEQVSLSKLISSPVVVQRFNDVLKDKAPAFISSVISVANSSALVGSDPMTVVSAAMVAATLDLPINPSLGFAYLVAYNDKHKGKKEAQFQMGYKGFIQLAMRSGQYQTINATDIREGEIIEEDLLSGEIKFKKLPADKRSAANVVGYAAFFRLLNGFEKTLYMSKEEINAHAMQYSTSYKFDKYKTSLWNTQFDTMAKKTVIKLLISKYGPLSVEMQRAQKFDQAVIKQDITDLSSIDEASTDYVDNQQDGQDADYEDVSDNTAANAARAAAMAAASKSFSDNEPELDLKS